MGLDTVFPFLTRRSSILAQPGSANKVRKLMHAHIDAAKKRELETQSLNAKASAPSKTSGIAPSTKKSISESEALAMEQKEKEKESKDADWQRRIDGYISMDAVFGRGRAD